MNDERITERAANSVSLTRRAARRFATSLRIVLIGAIFVASWYAVRGWSGLLSEWRQLSRPPESRQTNAADFESMAAVLPLAGQWSFAELDWDLKTSVLGEASVLARLEILATLPADDSDAQLPDVSAELVEMAQELKIRPIERGSNRIYGIDKPDLKAQLVVRAVAGMPKAVALAVAFPQDEQQWQLLELTPRTSADDIVATGQHLLPLPAEARRSGGRFAEDGTVLLELITLESNADELLSQWKSSGWEVRPSGLGGPDGFSYLCARGSDVVYAWSANSRDALENLMLVRTPDASDTGAE